MRFYGHRQHRKLFSIEIFDVLIDTDFCKHFELAAIRQLIELGTSDRYRQILLRLGASQRFGCPDVDLQETAIFGNTLQTQPH